MMKFSPLSSTFHEGGKRKLTFRGNDAHEWNVQFETGTTGVGRTAHSERGDGPDSYGPTFPTTALKRVGIQL